MKKILLLLSLLAIAGCGNSTPDESTAKEAARAAVIQNLKDVTSTEFHQNEKVKNLGDNTFEYKETVNAKNSFGGSIAQNVTVKVKWVKDDPSDVTNWTILDIQFTDR